MKVIRAIVDLIPIFTKLCDFTHCDGVSATAHPNGACLLKLMLTIVASFKISDANNLGTKRIFNVIILLTTFNNILMPQLALFNGLHPCLSIFKLSFDFFLSLIPTVGRALAQLPTSRPLTTKPNTNTIGVALLIIFYLFIIKFTIRYQLIHKRRHKLLQA